LGDVAVFEITTSLGILAPKSIGTNKLAELLLLLLLLLLLEEVIVRCKVLPSVTVSFVPVSRALIFPPPLVLVMVPEDGSVEETVTIAGMVGTNRFGLRLNIGDGGTCMYGLPPFSNPGSSEATAEFEDFEGY
jgi:hypothetical protein